MKVGTLNETITVSGAAPVVDVTSTTSTTQLTRETLEVIPTGRNSIVALMIQAPGARPQLDWSFVTGNPQFKVFGELGEQWVAMEGVVTSGPKTGTQGGNHYDYSAIEESTVSTVGNTAQAPTKGLQINVILKSGGDQFHGNASFFGTSHRLEFDNVNDALRSRGVTGGNPVKNRWDANGELGGRIIRNKLWFYYSARRRGEKVQTFNAFHDDGVTPSVSDQFQYFHTGKVSYQMNSSNKFIGFVQYVRQGGESTNDQFSSFDSRMFSPTQATTSKIEWQGIRGDKYMSLQSGAWIWNVSRQCYSDDVNTFDLLTSRLTGCNNNYGIDSFEGRNHTIGRLNWYKPSLFAGNHDFKTGFDYAAAHADRKISSRDGTKNKDTGFPKGNTVGNYRLLFRTPPGSPAPVPFAMDAYNNSYKDGQPDSVPKDLTHTFWAFVQDSWTIEAAADAESRRALRARSRVHSRAVPVGVRGSARHRVSGQVLGPDRFPDVELDRPAPPRGVRRPRQRPDGDQGRLGPVRAQLALRRAADGERKRPPRLALPVARPQQQQAVRTRRDQLQPTGRRLRVHEPLHRRRGRPGGRRAEPEHQGADEQRVLGLAGAQLMPDFRGARDRHLFAAAGLPRAEQPASVQRLQHPDHRPGPGPGRRGGHRRRPGTVDHLLRISRRRWRAAQLPAADAHQRHAADDQKYKSFEFAASKRLDRHWMMMASYSTTKIDMPHCQNTASTGNDFTQPGPAGLPGDARSERGDQYAPTRSGSRRRGSRVRTSFPGRCSSRRTSSTAAASRGRGR